MKVETSLLIDLYELTMSNCFKLNDMNEIAVFDYFFRKIPDKKSYAIFAGLETALNTIVNLKFDKSDIMFLREKNLFSDNFIEYLENFKFSGTVFAMKEGSVIFPNEPILIIKGPLIECQLIETILLLNLNHQSLIASKSRTIYTITKEKPFFEFGARRAQGESASILGARAAYIGGASGTSNVICNKLYNIPIFGTMSHSFIESFDSEYQAFYAYAKCFPSNTSLLIDTYDVMNGTLNAIKIEKEYLSKINKHLISVRLDSGDMLVLTKQIRALLDENGCSHVKILLSNSLDESSIQELLDNNCPVDSFGIGERLITAKNDPVFSGVYKISGLVKGNVIFPKMKLSANTDKETLPGLKQVYRFIDNNGVYLYDYICLYDEEIDNKKKSICLLDKVIENGRIIKRNSNVEKIRSYSLKEFNNLDNKYKTNEIVEYPVLKSEKLKELQKNVKKELVQS